MDFLDSLVELFFLFAATSVLLLVIAAFVWGAFAILNLDPHEPSLAERARDRAPTTDLDRLLKILDEGAFVTHEEMAEIARHIRALQWEAASRARGRE